MFKSDWYVKAAPAALMFTLVLIVIFAAGLFGYDLGRLQDETRYHTRNYAERSDDDIKRICSGFDTSAETVECAIKEKTSYRDAKRAEEDLGAQKEMARWAWYILLITGGVGTLTVIATGLGVYWVKKTLDVTALSVKLTRESVNLANTANTQTAFQSMRNDEYTRRQIRAYVVLNDAKINADYTDGVCVEFSIVNSGQTPAYDVIIHKVICLWPYDFKDMPHPKDDEMMGMDPIIAAPTSGVSTTISRPLSLGEREKLEEGTLVCVVIGLVTYLDVFDNSLRRERGDRLSDSEKKEWFMRFALRVENFGTDKERVVPFSKNNIAN